VAADRLPAQGADWRLRDLWLESVSIGFAERYGVWAVGRRWSVGEGDLDGGPVGHWCCFPHSVTTPDETADAVVASLIEWHAWLQDIADRFDRFLPLAADDLDGWERAVANLVTAVGDRTQYAREAARTRDRRPVRQLGGAEPGSRRIGSRAPGRTGGRCLTSSRPGSGSASRYLDVLFFQPYDDGNARLGGLVMHFVLQRAGAELDEAHPILTIVRRADDPEGAAGLARLVHGIAAATHRRWLRLASCDQQSTTP
jgi:hypothetical protein